MGEQYFVPVKPVESINRIEFDFCVIASEKEEIQLKMKAELLKAGVSAKKVILISELLVEILNEGEIKVKNNINKLFRYIMLNPI